MDLLLIWCVPFASGMVACDAYFFIDADDHGVSEVRRKHRVGLVKVAARMIYFARSDACKDSVNFDVRFRGRTGDFEGFAKRWRDHGQRR